MSPRCCCAAAERCENHDLTDRMVIGTSAIVDTELDGAVGMNSGMQELVDRLSDEYDWSDSVSNLSAKLQRESIRYKEVVELADVLGYDIVWQKRRDNR